MIHTVPELCREVEARITRLHISCFRGRKEPLFLVSDCYPGVWLEHVYDSVFYAKLHPDYVQLAVNTVRLFLDYQTPDGQLPCYVWNADKLRIPEDQLIGYGQVQECVSFARLCLETAEMYGQREFLERVYGACSRWEAWLRKHRMTTGRGLVEMFVGYDTGHDNSARFEGMKYPHNQPGENGPLNAACLPEGDPVAPILAVDMSCNLYGADRALAEMARLLGRGAEADAWEQKAAQVKQKLFEHCYCPEDDFFYDVDRNGNQRKYLSSTIFHLFMERVLDPQEDAELIGRIVERHIKNPKEFWTPYPFPSMAASDPSFARHTPSNCWGYFSQGLIALRCTRWMDAYGMGADLDALCEKWLAAWTACYDEMKFGQELDPMTGEPSSSSEWYSSCMLFYLYAARRLGRL